MGQGTQTILRPEYVEVTYLECLFSEGEDNAQQVLAEGIRGTVGFHRDRLEQYRQTIQAMLMELPTEFLASQGGGWSFLNACNDRHGNMWTGLHSTMERLILLGMAIGKVECLIPRAMWPSLPGGMPYYKILDT